MADRILDIENIGRIGQMLISGDTLSRAMVDDYTWDEDETNYDFAAFNELKWMLMKIERMNPDMYLCGALWIWYRANRRMVIPAIAGKSAPRVGHVIMPADPALMDTLQNGVNSTCDRGDNSRTYYFPIRNSLDAIVGALELTTQAEIRPYVYRYDAVSP